MKFISAALLALVTTSLVSCGAPSKKRTEYRPYKGR